MSPLEILSCLGATGDGADKQSDESPAPDHNKQDCKTDTSLVSQASTVKYSYYGHVPYTQFEPQVMELCRRLWPAPTDKATKKSLTKRRRQALARALRLKQLLLPPQSNNAPRDFVIEHLRGGSFNRVVGITMVEQDEPNTRMVLRIPRGNLAEPEHDVTILQFVQDHVVVPIPEVISYDFTRNNPLKAPYVLQQRIPGLDLESKIRSYPDLTHEQKKMFVDEFCQILMNLQFIEHPYAGKIDARLSDEGEKEFTVGPFPNAHESDELIAKRAAEMPFFKIRKYGDTKISEDGASSDSASSSAGKPEHQTPFFFIMTQFGRSKYQVLEYCPSAIWEPDCVTDRLVTAAIQMNDLGYLDAFEDEKHSFCLTHYDLDPRNIMVDIEEDGKLKITGILDWDLAMFAPKWVHCRPPMWIWNWLDGGNEDHRKANDTPPTEEQQELKELFDENMGSDYTFCAYNTAYRLARTLFRIALWGICSEKAVDDAESLLEEWEEFYEQGNIEDASGDDEGVKKVEEEPVEGSEADADAGNDGNIEKGASSERSD